MTEPASPSALAIAALHASHSGCWLADAGGTVRALSRGEAILAAADTPLLMLNAPLVANRLGYPELSGLDLLELFAFLHPARFMVPTPKGLAEALALPVPATEDEVPLLLARAAAALFAVCESESWREREGAWSALQSLAKMRWPWAGLLAPHIARPQRAERWLFARLPEWEERPPRAQPAQITLDEAEVEQRLDTLTGAGAERRPGQRAYARAAAHVFAPREPRAPPAESRPNMLLAQAGTGIGKTLAYLAPASLWAKAAGGTVWVSTYTKALQRQLRRESRRAWPDREASGEPPEVVVRKGRENYLCLLNLEDALQGGFSGRAAIFAQLVARWAGFSEDGDMVGGDLPGWLVTLFRRRGMTALTDRRGECIYAGCPHYRKCFIERAVRDSAHADLVIANHALVMVHAARAGGAGGAGNGGSESQSRPSRIIFDEGHHLFEAADSIFAASLSGGEAIELRRWVLGPESRAKGRRRGLAARLADVASYDERGASAIADARAAAELLPADGWLARLGEGAPLGPLERLFDAVRALTYARDESSAADASYGIETEAVELGGHLVERAGEAHDVLERAGEAHDVLERAGEAHDALARLRRPLVQLGARLDAIAVDPPDWLDAQGRQRIEGARHALAWRIDALTAWEALLARLHGPADPDFIDWLAVERGEAREFDVAIHRRWLDPMRPFAAAVLAPAHGVMQTSATLCDRSDDGFDWDHAIRRSGAAALDIAPRLAEADSPFDYARQAEVLIVTDVKKGDIASLAAAYGRLIEASGGGVLGLFTAIRRLRAVHARIADRLARAGLPLFAQHVDPIDTGTLVDIFRDDPRASLLGTDALRDGVDVPGDSLRLVVMEQVPWPKPSILHRARRAAFVDERAAPVQFDFPVDGSRVGLDDVGRPDAGPARSPTRPPIEYRAVGGRVGEPAGAGRSAAPPGAERIDARKNPAPSPAKARSAYDDAIIRTRLAQAFGRLIRTREDAGRFVVLSPAFPSRLLSAFPEGTPVRRVRLDEALQIVAGGVSSAGIRNPEPERLD